jgi:hypothetical protein
MIQYILLTCRFRHETYESRTGLFNQIKEQSTMQRLNKRLWGLFPELLKTITELFDEIDQIQLFEKIIQNDKAHEKKVRIFEPSGIIKNVA